jgi:hypothetical protein
MSMDKVAFKKRIVHGLRMFLLYFIFLALFFSVFTIYRSMIISQYTNPYFDFSYDIIEALILAKIIIIGQEFGLGERFKGWPLIIPTIYKAVVFGILVIIFKILEHFITGLIRGESSNTVFQKLVNTDWPVLLAQGLVMFFVFILLFSFVELENVLGESKVYNLFFKRRDLETDKK